MTADKLVAVATVFSRPVDIVTLSDPCAEEVLRTRRMKGSFMFSIAVPLLCRIPSAGLQFPDARALNKQLETRRMYQLRSLRQKGNPDSS